MTGDGGPRWLALATALLCAAAFLGAIGLVWAWSFDGPRVVVVAGVVSFLLAWGLVFALSSRPRAELRLHFALTLVSASMALALLELTGLLGLLDYRALFGASDERPWLNPGNRFDPELLWVREPGLALRGVEYRGNIGRSWCLPDAPLHSRHDLVYDAHGFRNASAPAAAAIAVIGDSYVESVEVPVEQAFPTVLAGLSGASVANLGLSGYGPQQELEVLERFAMPLGPRTVVWAFYEGNDLGDLLDFERRVAELDALPRQPTLSDRTFLENAATALWRALLGCRLDERAQTRHGILRGADGSAAKMYFVDGEAPPGPRWIDALTRFGEILGQAFETTRAGGADLVVAYLPTKWRIYADLVEIPPHSELAEWPRSDLPSRLRELVARISPQIGFIDVTDALRARAASGELVYLLDDTHWTAAGHATVADALHAFLPARAPARPPE